MSTIQDGRQNQHGVQKCQDATTKNFLQKVYYHHVKFEACVKFVTDWPFFLQIVPGVYGASPKLKEREQISKQVRIIK